MPGLDSNTGRAETRRGENPNSTRDNNKQSPEGHSTTDKNATKTAAEADAGPYCATNPRAGIRAENGIGSTSPDVMEAQSARREDVPGDGQREKVCRDKRARRNTRAGKTGRRHAFEAVPVHLRPVLNTTLRRASAALDALIEKVEWPDEQLPADIMWGMQTVGHYANTRGLDPARKHEEVRHESEWLQQQVFINEEEPPPRFEDEVLQKLADGMQEFIDAGRAIEVQAEDLVVPPALCFPKKEIKTVVGKRTG